MVFLLLVNRLSPKQFTIGTKKKGDKTNISEVFSTTTITNFRYSLPLSLEL